MASVAAQQCSKIVAIHLNYRSRAAERGKCPQWPSYFLKPPSTLSTSGAPVVRPRGCELLAFEGEIALIIGQRARGVSPEQGWKHVGWVTAANDFGVYDLRYADNGSNVRSKGVDGFTPLGPSLVDAQSLDPVGLRLRTWLNGDVVQDALTGEELLFSFGQIVADLSRLMTLEPMDVVLTGTPTGSTVVAPGDVVEVEVVVEADGRSTGRLVSPIVEGAALEPYGAPPRIDATQRAAAVGRNSGAAERRGQRGRLVERFGEPVVRALGEVATATLASQLRRRGLDGLIMDDLESTRPDVRMVGCARTIRYLPRREDLPVEVRDGLNAQKWGIEEVEPGDVVVIEADGRTDAGTIGDILALRAKVRGAVGVITDGAVRDWANLRALEMPVYHCGRHPAVLGRRHMPFETDVTVRCAGVTVRPGDVLVGDGDGVVIVPSDLVDEIVADAQEQERQERFIVEMVAAGERIHGLYPVGPAWRQRYEEWLAQPETGDGR